MKISVITISYNQNDYLVDAINAVLSQEYEDIEYIIIDPGSTDGSRETIRSYGDRIDSVVFEQDNGPADGLNRGLAKASGDILYYLNADDVVRPDAFASMVAEFRRNPDIDVIYGDGHFIDGDGQVLGPALSDHFNPLLFRYGAVRVIQQSTYLRRSAVERAGGFNANNRTCWDRELLVDVMLAGGRFRYVPGFNSYFRIHESSITGQSSNTAAYHADRERIFAKANGSMPKRYDRLLGSNFGRIQAMRRRLRALLRHQQRS